jgi:hypothetical protein
MKSDPQDSYVAVGQTFTVNVSIVDVSNLTAWMFTVYFRNSVLNCVNASEGPFLSAVAGPYGTTFIKRINNTFSSTYGAVDVGCSLLGSNVSASGSGVLATVEFEAMSRGNTLLHLTNIELDDNSFPPQIIPYNSVDGMVYVSGGLIPGDLNVDGYVNAKDAVILGTAFGSRPSDPNWNSNADINGDGIVNAKDAVILGTHFGQGP